MFEMDLQLFGGRGTSYNGGRSRGTGKANFSSIQEAQDALNKEGLFGYVNLEDPYTGKPTVDLKTANAIYDITHQIATEFPELKGIAYALYGESMEAGTYAHCHMYRGEVNFSTRYFNDYDRLSQMSERDTKAGWSPQGTEDPKSIIAHEFGHAIDGWLTYQKQMFGYTPSGNVKFASSVLRPKVMKAAGLKVSDVGTQVSRYATTNAKEWFAESFAEYTCSPNPRPAAAEFGRQLRQLIKEAAKK